jgi:hypothetical protein
MKAILLTLLLVPRELPLGKKLDWTPTERPSRAPLRGSYALLRPVEAATDAEPLYAVSHPPDGDPAIWTYLPSGPYESPRHMQQMLGSAETSVDPLFLKSSSCPKDVPSGSRRTCESSRSSASSRSATSGSAWPLQRTTAAERRDPQCAPLSEGPAPGVCGRSAAICGRFLEDRARRRRPLLAQRSWRRWIGSPLELFDPVARLL